MGFSTGKFRGSFFIPFCQLKGSCRVYRVDLQLVVRFLFLPELKNQVQSYLVQGGSMQYFCVSAPGHIWLCRTYEPRGYRLKANTFVMSYRIACIVILIFLLFYWVGFHAVDLQPVATNRLCNVSFDATSVKADGRGEAMLDAFFASLLNDPEASGYSIVIDPHHNELHPDTGAVISISRAKWLIDHCREKYDVPVSRFYIQDIDDNSSSHPPGFAGISLRLKRTGS